jgi:CRP-like cAMP-binding protein
VIATNRLLTGLPEPDRRRLLADCEQVTLRRDDLLCQAGARLRHVYFPTGCLISLVTPLASCAGLEVALIGSEGMDGVALLLGVPSSPLNHLVHGSGDAWRIGAPEFRRALRRSPALRRRLNAYAYVKMQQIAQTAACTRYHLVEQRLARWLLTTRDRTRSNRLHATHELLGYMLGVRRVGITKAATSLQNRGLIRYSRGNVTVLDRRGPGVQLLWLLRGGERVVRQHPRDRRPRASAPARRSRLIRSRRLRRAGGRFPAGSWRCRTSDSRRPSSV